MDDELSAHDAMRLGVAAALEPAGLPELAHLLLEGRDDRIDVGLFAGKRSFLGDLQAFIRAPQVDQRRGQARERIAQQGIERGTEEGIKPALQMHQKKRYVTNPVQERRAGVGWRDRSTRVRIHGREKLR